MAKLGGNEKAADGQKFAGRLILNSDFDQ